MQGWITLHRKIEENELWLSEPFTKGQAWVDLIMLANHKQKTLWKRGIKVVINRGEVGWSEAKLAGRWQWSRGKVRRYLKYLETAQQIEHQSSHTLSRIIIKNYDRYQQNGTTDGTTDGTNNNNVNNVNNIPADAENKDMAWNKHSDEYEEGVVDYDSGELHDPEAEKKEKDKAFTKKADELIEWLINHQGRKRNLTSFPKQRKALKELVKMKKTGEEAKRIIVEKENEDYWKNRPENPDFWTVVSVLQKRGK